MLIKLDSGNYINTEAVEVINGGDSPYIGLRSNNSFDITTADCDRIVEAMAVQAKKLRLEVMALERRLTV